MATEQLTVRELMRLDSEQALEAARQRQAPQAPETSAGVGPRGGVAGSTDLRLVGIYGVGRRLFAEVRSGTQAFLFLRGHRLPVGHIEGDSLYRLKELAGACVRLERHQEETVLCLSQRGVK